MAVTRPAKKTTARKRSKSAARRRRAARKPETFPVRIAGAGEGIVHHQMIERRPTSRYLMKELFD